MYSTVGHREMYCTPPVHDWEMSNTWHKSNREILLNGKHGEGSPALYSFVIVTRNYLINYQGYTFFFLHLTLHWTWLLLINFWAAQSLLRLIDGRILCTWWETFLYDLVKLQVITHHHLVYTYFISTWRTIEYFLYTIHSWVIKYF